MEKGIISFQSLYDLLEGIYDYEAGYINNAVFEWKLLHHAHWGNHVVAAVKALQHLRQE